MEHSSEKREKFKNKNCSVNNSAPDAGWGWIIVFASFMVHFVTDGVIISLGELYEQFLIEFHAGNSATSGIISTITGTALCSGPIASALVNTYGCRVVTIAGSLIATGFILASVYATNVYVLLVTMGFGSGFGFGLIYLPAMVCVTYYFDKHRSIAMGIAMCGTGIGTVVFGVLFKYLRSKYDINTALFSISFALLTCILFGMLFQPLSNNKAGIANNNNEYVIDVEKIVDTEKNIKPEMVLLTAEIPQNNCTESKSTNQNSSSTFKTEDNVEDTNPEMVPLTSEVPQNSSRENKSSDQNSSSTFKNEDNVEDTNPEMVSLTAEIPQNNDTENKSSDQKSSSIIKNENNVSNDVNKIPSVRYKDATVLEISELKTLSEIMKHSKHADSQKIDLNSKNKTHLRSKKNKTITSFMNELKKVFYELADFSILKNPIFIFFVISNFLTSLGYDIPFIFIPIQANSKHIDANNMYVSFLSMVGVGTIFGRIILTYIADKPCINILYFYNACLTLCGILTAISTLSSGNLSFNIFCLLYGFMSGSYISLTPVITADLFGLEKTTNALGIILFSQGIAAYAGPPIAGGLCDYFKSHDPAFYFSGAVIALSGLMLYILPSWNSYLQEKKQNKSKNRQRNRIYKGPELPINYK